jgi:hypothetical protein
LKGGGNENKPVCDCEESDFDDPNNKRCYCIKHTTDPICDTNPCTE